MKIRKTFTLIEILAVVALIAILSALGYAGYSYAQHASKESATKALIARVEAALEAAKSKSGFIPRSSSFNHIAVTNTSVTIGGITYSDTASGNNKYQAEFAKAFIKAIDLSTMNRFLNSNGYIVDAWGNDLLLRFPGKLKKGGIDIVSPGPDGELACNGASADEESGKFRDEDGDWICDDVANF